MRSDLETELNSLHVRFAEMAMMVRESIQKAMTAFDKNDLILAQQVIDEDQKINNREVDLEQRSFELIALQQPVTSDLRRIVTILKASSDFERMGDHAVRIARTTISLQNKAPIVPAKQLLAQMAQALDLMFSDALDAYLKENDQKAIVISQQDHDVNQLAHDVDQICITEMKANGKTVEDGTAYMLISTYLERMGDYVTNLCEWVVYLKRGKISELG
ncbi:phosphate signaling complex protein PhoU [Bombilactobacillus folatiphilus]|uniref:Phosphate-specific transport system accessory protein PhoU n=1 Tax=Bombilactobacillus folatiphilus TaxID=2923362 RepID=A0ABY4P7Q6_9LACO|nr:phosphate signaling complex protein PhoU [Bombilactobacillus folatiphilus]UQS81687.1 phosphate signaling complex protein PhoU [Bombilactobacillus folatiphilus]